MKMKTLKLWEKETQSIARKHGCKLIKTILSNGHAKMVVGKGQHIRKIPISSSPSTRNALNCHKTYVRRACLELA